MIVVFLQVKEVTGRSRRYIQGEAAKPLLIKLRQTVNVVVALVNLCKVHDKVLKCFLRALCCLRCYFYVFMVNLSSLTLVWHDKYIFMATCYDTGSCPCHGS